MVFLLLAACSAGVVKLDEGAVGDTAGTEDSDDTADSGDTAETADSADTTDTTDSGGASISDLTASVDPLMESIIELNWTQAGTARVRAQYSFDDGDWLDSPEWTVGDGAHRLLLLGIPFETEVTWRLLVDDVSVQDNAAIETGDLPRGVPEVEDWEGNPDAWDPDARWLLLVVAPGGGADSVDEAWSFIIDRQGRPVWAASAPRSRTSFAAQLSADGTEILFDYNSWWGAFDGGVNSEVARLDIEGTEIDRWEAPGLIHPFTQTGDGALIWSASLGTAGDGEELRILDDDGKRELFDCNAFSRAHGGGKCGSNATWWDASTNHVLYSLYSDDFVVELTLEGEVVRYFGQLDDAWEFADDSSEFYWQHGAQYLSDGHLLLSTRVTESKEETAVREYELDEDREELVEVWSFGEGEGVWAYILGEPHRLGNGNTLHNYGSTVRVREATPDGEVVWDLQWGEIGTMGRMSVVEDIYALWHESP